MQDPDPDQVQDAFDELYRELKGVRDARDDDPVPFYSERKKQVNESKPRVSPVTRYVHSLGKGFKTTGEVAEELGVSDSYIRKLSDHKVTQAPSYKAEYGQHEIRVFTPEDVEALRQYIENQTGGLTPT